MDSGSVAIRSSNKNVMTVPIIVVLVASLLGSSSGCQFPAIYTFGDSNSDTGSVSSAFSRVPPPYGETFFGKPSGRCSDGRLLVDFIGKHRQHFCDSSLKLCESLIAVIIGGMIPSVLKIPV